MHSFIFASTVFFASLVSAQTVIGHAEIKTLGIPWCDSATRAKGLARAKVAAIKNAEEQCEVPVDRISDWNQSSRCLERHVATSTASAEFECLVSE